MRRKIIATDVLLLLAGVLIAARAQAADIGVMTNLSGPLLARTADGTVKVLAVGSTLELGETLLTRPQGYALASLADHTTVMLGPDSALTIGQYSFSAENPGQPGSAQLTLVHGQARIVAGLLGARGTDRLVLHTTLADINLHKADLIVSYSPAQAAPAQRPMAWSVAPQLPQAYNDYAAHAAWTSPEKVMAGGRLIQVQNALGVGNSGLIAGLYVEVVDGMISVANSGGTQNFTAGQFGFTPGFQQPPVILPTNPGMQFNPPPIFSSTGGTQNGNGGGKPGDVQCVVR